MDNDKLLQEVSQLRSQINRLEQENARLQKQVKEYENFVKSLHQQQRQTIASVFHALLNKE